MGKINQIIIAVIIAAITGFGGTFWALNNTVTRLEEKVIALNDRVTRLETNKTTSIGIGKDPVGDPSTINPLTLQTVIKEKQEKRVKKSQNVNICFNEEDFKKFVNGKIPEIVVNELMLDNSFIDLVISIKKMNPTERQQLLDSSSTIAKQTWTEMDKISPEGQTEVGQKAELLIANAIVLKVKELINLSEDDLKKKQQ